MSGRTHLPLISLLTITLTTATCEMSRAIEALRLELVKHYKPIDYWAE